ncbi:SpoIIE family protein phosphatase [Streptomyces sp. NBC_00053]|uniref:SpoIIE family protein phosphatase n=1 Tax=unclassified Streptomyces TaxID=2593676 RepID=UPI000F5BB405|nr:MULTISPECIES: SpoIIE family protein phosphatase [unclassified Streptomyces]WSG55501.1 SpoIIE family protein phosphatase [Streptomyces sp. NBC_01732]MCX4391400.1 SpoIIE family protein phosphatase [Streptomyces sp. NBC_01767]MCX5098145.1 SpoIIE family protein phosphatase [Streptomyces sp. NBC_00439]MCX5498022.1 SpoIIE family protein phosphatase [Streptomyces sp. NBC_00052]MCX5553446.1 SpoIIE family protein phosphatase [Streptomyces sp. NBC_00051]
MRGPAVPASAAGPGTGLLDAVLADVMRDTGASVGLVFLLPLGERVLRLVLASGMSREIAAPWARVPINAAIPVADAVRQRRLVWLGSQEEIARRYPRVGIVLPYDFRVAAAPITDGTTVWGGIVLLWPVWHPAQLSDAEQETITAFCRRAAPLLRQAADSGRPLGPADEPRLLPAPHSREADSAQAVAALHCAEQLPVGCCALDLDGRLTYINPAGAELVGAGAASLLGKRPWEVLLWLHDPVFEDRYREAAVSRQPTAFTARRPPDIRLSFQLYPHDSGISVHITPTGGDPSATAAKAAAPSPAGLVGATGLYHLTHLATALAEAVGVQDVVELAADQIVPAFGPEALALLAVDDGRLRITGYRGYSPELMDRFDAAPLTSDTPAARVVTTGVASFFATFADLKRAYPPAVNQDEMAAWAFLPLIVSGRPVGSLVLAYDQPRPFPPAERAMLTSLTGLIAQALDRARLYDAKLTLAHTLQTGLLPHTLPRLPGFDVAARYRPAGHGMDIGGDFYDLIVCSPTTAVAVIGDVQGHNTTAAALMGQVRTAVHAYAATVGASPGKVLACTNRLLVDLDPGLFASCLIAHLDHTHHRALLATAGHPPALLRHPDGHTDILRVPPGLLLGIDPAADYPTTEIPLPPGAVLALYTDGLVETPGTDIDDATNTLAGHLAAVEPENLDALADVLLRHAEQSAPRYDDIALLLIRPHDGR